MAPELHGVGRLDIAVSNVRTSARWYENVLGLTPVETTERDTSATIVLRHPHAALLLALHPGLAEVPQPTDHRPIGMGPVGFRVGRREDLALWAEHFVSLGVEHAPITDTEGSAVLAFHDPDHIELSLWWEGDPLPSVPAGADAAEPVLRRTSPYGVAETVRRIVSAARSKGVTVFAEIDHAAGARSVGLEMPETTVVILGHPAQGTPAMLAAPDLALDLPARVLVRESSSGSVVMYQNPQAIAVRYGLSPDVGAALQGIGRLLEAVLAS